MKICYGLKDNDDQMQHKEREANDIPTAYIYMICY